MRPAHLLAACGTALALCFTSFAQTSQPDRANENVRLAQPTRTPTARQIDARARTGDSALALFEGVWKVDVVMMRSSDSRWDIPVTTPVDPNAPGGANDRTRDQANPTRDQAERPSDQPRTLPDPANPNASSRQPTGTDRNVISEGQTFTAYAESRVIMNGNMLQETMALPREAAMMSKSATRPGDMSSPSTRTPTSSTPSSTPRSGTSTSGNSTSGTSASGTSTSGTATSGGSGTAAVPQPTTPGQTRTDGLDPALTGDTVMVMSFLSLNADSGTFTKVCMDGESGEIKHETGTFETESDRIVFTGEEAGSGTQRDGTMREGMINPADRSRPAGTSPASAPEAGASRPSAVAPPTNRDPASGISGTTRRGTTPDQPTSTTSGSGLPSDSRSASARHAADTHSLSGWDSTWGKDCRVVVDILGPNERRVTVYKVDPSIPGNQIPGSPESGVRNGTDPESGVRDDGVARTTPETDQVRAKAIVAGQIVCQATYTRVSGSEAESVRRVLRENNAFASSDRD